MASKNNTDTKIAVMANDIKHIRANVKDNKKQLAAIQSDIQDFKEYLDKHFVTQNEFRPVKWFIATILGAIVAFVFAISRDLI